MNKGLSLLLLLLFAYLNFSCSKDKNDDPILQKIGVTGKVFNSVNFPLKNATILLSKKTGTGVAETVKTSDNGEYLMFLDKGEYTIQAKIKGYDVSSGELNLIDKDTTLNFTLLGKSDLTGMVADAATGKGVSGAVVSFVRDTASTPIRGEYQVEFELETDIDGNYELLKGPEGKFITVIEKEGYSLKKSEVFTLSAGDNIVPTVLLTK